MKIAHVVWGMKTGGVETMLVNIINEQVKTEEVRLFIINDFIDEFIVKKISPYCKVSRLNRKPGSRNFIEILVLNIRVWKYSPDIVHVHSSRVSKLLKGRWNIVRTIHNTDNVPYEYPKMKALFAISDAVRGVTVKQGFSDVKTIFNGILTKSIKSRSKSTPEDGIYRLVQVSRLDINQKGQDILVRAVDKLVHICKITNFLLYLIGEGESEKQLRDLVDQLDLRDYVIFKGLKTQDYIYNHLCDYDLFIQPSRFEGFGITVAEALAAKVPVIVSNIEGPMEIINQGEYGMSFQVGDADDLAEKIKVVLQGGYDDSMIEKAYQHVCKEYDVAVTAREYIDAYNSVIQSK
ncbi:MAG: glycosyltransferase [Prevotella sp.]|nr:glycosyltransferase [Prevotella sp.]